MNIIQIFQTTYSGGGEGVGVTESLDENILKIGSTSTTLYYVFKYRLCVHSNAPQKII